MASRGRGGRGKRARAGTSSPSIPPIQGFEDVVFATQNQRNRFEILRGTTLNPTRFLSINAMITLGLNDTMRNLFAGTGLTSLYGMQEPTYYSLTLEFLSSLKMDKDTYALSFRISSEDYTLTLAEFGNHLGLGRSVISRAPLEFDGHTLWSCMSNRPLARGFTNIRVNDVQHPALRIWFRTVIGTIFGRGEFGTVNFTELSILGSFLNVQRGNRFILDLPYLVAKHMVDVAESRIKTIEIGGLITFLVKKMGFYCEDLAPVETKPRWIDCAYMRGAHKWFDREPRVNRWKIATDQYITLPSANLPALVTLRAGDGQGLPSYLIQGEGNEQNAQVARVQQQRRQQHQEEASSSAPPPTQDEISQYRFDYLRHQFTHQAVNQNLMSYDQYHRNVVSGLSEPPHPSFYRGASTSGIFEEAGIDPSTWGASSHESYGGFGGQFLDDFARVNLGGGGGYSGSTEEYGDDGYGEDEDEE